MVLAAEPDYIKAVICLGWNRSMHSRSRSIPKDSPVRHSAASPPIDGSVGLLLQMRVTVFFFCARPVFDDLINLKGFSAYAYSLQLRASDGGGYDTVDEIKW
ncbi:unnamed protein product [Calypogeia fissa]